MKSSYKIIFTLLLIYAILITKPSYAQKSRSSRDRDLNTSKITPLEKGFIQIFSKSFPGKVLKDSISMYAINFTIDVTIDKNNKTAVTRIIANDSLGYVLFPKYLDLKKLNYTEIFLAGEKKISIIMPILIFGYTENKIKYRDEDGNPLISLKSATNTAFHLYTDFPYDNLKEGKAGYPSYLNKYQKNDKGMFIRKIILRPMISNLTTVN